jgi:DHA1 family multidrug resistance protein-like MFS transporter
MSELIRDTVFGHTVRFLTKGRYFQYEEEKDPSLWKKYVNVEKSGHMAYHGATHAPEEAAVLSDSNFSTRNPAQDTAQKLVDGGNAPANEFSGTKIDPEKGRDLHIVDWWGPNDPEVNALSHV